MEDPQNFYKAVQTRDTEAVSQYKKQIYPMRGWKIDPSYILNYAGRVVVPSNMLYKHMVQLYFMACCRTVPFNSYQSSPIVAYCCKHFVFENMKPDYHSIYGTISRFLPLDTTTTGTQMARYFLNTNVKTIVSEVIKTFEDARIPILSRDFMFESKNLGSLDEVEVLINLCIQRVEDIVYGIKWNCMYPRPVEVSHLLQHPQFSNLLKNPIVQKHKELYSIIHLTTVGDTPNCPSLPSVGVSSMAACCVILSYFYDVNGTLLIDGRKYSILDELHRVVNNIAQGHCWAGHEYSIDANDIQLGEKIGIEILQMHINRTYYPITFTVPLWGDRCQIITNSITSGDPLYPLQPT